MPFSFHHSRHDEAPILIPAIGLELRVCLPGTASGDAMSVIETINTPGFGPPLHRHRETEVFRVLSGRYLYAIDGKRLIAEEGDVVSVPGGAAHAFINIADQPARQMVMILPAFDAAAFFTQLGGLMKNGVPPREALNRFGAAWGMEFLGPPLRRE